MACAVNLTLQELKTLKEIIDKHQPVSQLQFPLQGNMTKKQAWEEVTREYNSVEAKKRTYSELRNAWMARNLRKRRLHGIEVEEPVRPTERAPRQVTGNRRSMNFGVNPAALMSEQQKERCQNLTSEFVVDLLYTVGSFLRNVSQALPSQNSANVVSTDEETVDVKPVVYNGDHVLRPRRKRRRNSSPVSLPLRGPDSS